MYAGCMPPCHAKSPSLLLKVLDLLDDLLDFIKGLGLGVLIAYEETANSTQDEGEQDEAKGEHMFTVCFISCVVNASFSF